MKVDSCAIERSGLGMRLDHAATKLTRAPVKRNGPDARASDSGMKWNEKSTRFCGVLGESCR